MRSINAHSPPQGKRLLANKSVRRLPRWLRKCHIKSIFHPGRGEKMTLQPIKIEVAMNNLKTLNLSDEVDAPVECGKQSIHDRSLCFYNARLFFKLATPVLRVGKCVRLLALILGVLGNLNAQNWVGFTSGNISTGANWSNNPAFNGATDLVFSSISTNSTANSNNSFLGSNLTIRTLSYDANADTNLRTRFTTTKTGDAGANLTFSASSGGSSITIASGATAAISFTVGSNVGNLTAGADLQIDHNGSGLFSIAPNINGSGNLAFSGSGNTTISGIIATGSASLSKIGSGTLTLNGTNTYTGATSVNNGTLALGSAGSIASGSVLKIASGATFDVKSKTVGGFTLNNPLTIDVGAANAGKLDAAGVALTYGNTLTLNITTSTPLSTYNLFTFTSEAGSFNTITLSGSFSGSMTSGSGVWTATSNGYDFTFNESTGVLAAATAAVPEPGTWVLIGIGAAFSLYRMGRKKSFVRDQN
jgi:autotransporter-associated beta strand protein